VAKNRSFFLSIFFILFYPHNTNAVVKGSETAVSVESLATFLSEDSDNIMLGFGWFKNGFTLQDSSTTCTFDCVYPVSGTATFNGGSLYLSQDLFFQNSAHLAGSGHIYANDYTVELCSSITELYSTFTFHDVMLALGGDLHITSTIIFDGDCSICGGLFHVSIEGDGAILLSEGSTLALDDLIVEGVSGKNIVCEKDSCNLILHNTDLVQSGDFIFDTGSIEFLNCITFCGTYTFAYESSQTSTIGSNTRWTIIDGLTLKVGRKEAVDYVEPFYFVDNSSILRLDSCSLVITDSGIGLTRGTFELDRDVYIDVASSTTTYGLTIGNGQESGDFSMNLDSGTSVHLTGGCWVYNNYVSEGKLHALSEDSRFLRYGDSKFYVMRDWVIPSMILKVASGSPTNVVADGAELSYNDTHVVLDGASLHVTGKEMLPGFKLRGNEMLFFNMGQLSFPIYTSGSGNKIHGNGKITGAISLQDSSTDLCFYLGGSISESIALSGGTLSLMSDFYLEGDAVLTGSGTVSLLGNRFNFGSRDTTWASDLEWSGDNGSICMSSNVDLVGTWTFSGTTVLDGGGKTLNLNGGGIEVDEGATLNIRDLRLSGVDGTKIRCLDSAGVIILEDVTWLQRNDYEFKTGAIQWKRNVKMSGGKKFSYKSDQTSTILNDTKLILDSNFTFSYDPGSTSKTLLAFIDETSELVLNGATLHATVTGMQMKKGKLVLKGAPSFSSEKVVIKSSPIPSLIDENIEIDEGITLGTGQAGEDCVCELTANAHLELLHGSLIYKNVSQSSWIAHNAETRVYISNSSKLIVEENFDLGQTILLVGKTASVEKDDETQLTGSVVMVY